MVWARTVAVAVGALGCLLAGPAAAFAETCDPRGSGGAEQVVTTPKPQGYDVTEVYGEGVYRVTRCDAAGRLIEGQTVAPIVEPGGDVALVPSTYATPRASGSVLYGDPRDPVWARAWAAGGERVKDSVLPPPPGVDVAVPAAATLAFSAVQVRGSGTLAGTGVRAAQADPACRNGAFVRYGATGFWPARRYTYRINGKSFGNIARTRQSLVAGHRAWDETHNDCGFNDQSNIVTRYAGLTARKARTNADGFSVIDKGELANITACGRTTVAIACSWLQPSAAEGPYVENDQRYDDDYPYVNDAAVSDGYDYRGVSTHESGHSIGLDHTTASPRLTMFPQATRAATFWRTLGRGDVLGMRNIYP